MANFLQNIEDPILALVDRWTIDYFSRLLWRHFEEYGNVVSEWIEGFIRERQCIQTLETQPGENLDLLELRSRLLIQFMCRMSAGAMGNTIVKEKSEEGLTELEEAIDILEQIVVTGNHSLSSVDLRRIRLSVKQQAVYACCREGNFDLAAKVFCRQWMIRETEEDMEVRKVIAEVLDSRNHDHEHLKSMTYETTIDDCKHILRKIFDYMAPPFLVRAARNVWERINNENVVQNTGTDLSLILKIEQADKVPTKQEQNEGDVSVMLANEVCAHSADIPDSSSGLKTLPETKQVAEYDKLNNFVAMGSAPPKEQTFSQSLGTIYLSSETLSTGIISVLPTSDSHSIVGNHSVKLRKQLAGMGQKDIYSNTVLIGSGQTYAVEPVIQETGSAIKSSLAQQMWPLPASFIGASTLPEEPICVESEQVVPQQPESRKKRGRKKRKIRGISREKIGLDSPAEAECRSSLPCGTETASSRPSMTGALKKIRSKGKLRASTELPLRDAKGNQDHVSADDTTKYPSASLKHTTTKKEQPLRRNKLLSEKRRNKGDPGPVKKVPVIHLTKISNEILQKLPKVSERLLMSCAGTGSTHVTKEHILTCSDSKSEKKVHKRRHIAEDETEAFTRKARNDSYPLSNMSSAENVKRPKRSSRSRSRPRALPGDAGVVHAEPKSKVRPVSVSPEMGGKVRKACWKPEETEAFYRAVQKHGHRWSHLSRNQFPNRSPADLANKWRLIMNGKLLITLEEKFGHVV